MEGEINKNDFEISFESIRDGTFIIKIINDQKIYTETAIKKSW